MARLGSAAVRVSEVEREPVRHRARARYDGIEVVDRNVRTLFVIEANRLERMNEGLRQLEDAMPGFAIGSDRVLSRAAEEVGIEALRAVARPDPAVKPAILDLVGVVRMCIRVVVP